MESVGNNPRVVRLSPAQIKILAHPLRVRLLGLLRTDGPATATALARALDTNTGATSYHLRQLAEVGLVEEEPDRGAGRQRWWRAAHELSSWRPTDFDKDPDASAAVDWLRGHQVRVMDEQVERWLAVEHTYPMIWRDTAGMSDIPMRLTPQRARSLRDEMSALIARHQREADSDEPGAERVTVFFAMVPRVDGPGR